MNYANIIIVILFIVGGLIVFIPLCLLQIYLSKRKSSWPGLILPILSGVLSGLLLMGILVYSANAYIMSVPERNHVEIIELYVQRTSSQPATRTDTVAVWWRVLLMLPPLLLPPVVFTAIYIVCRLKMRKKPPVEEAPAAYASPAELEKMNIQDL